MRRKFNPNAVASAVGSRIRVSHDRPANTTGRTSHAFCGEPIIISDGYVYRKGNCIGRAFETEYGLYLIGPRDKGFITCS